MKKYFVLLALLLVCGVCPARSAQADPDFVGFFDVGDCNVIAGWAADINNLNTPIRVSIFVDGQLLTNMLANGSRPDVGAAIGDNGLHGFSVTTPSVLKTGAPRSVSVRFESTTTSLSNSPRTINCPAAAFTIQNPKITRFKIQSDSNKTTADPNLTLEVEFDRPPSFYRIREIQNINRPEDDLKNRAWQPYTSGMSFTLRLSTLKPYGTRHVYMQINSGTSESGASPPKGDSVILAPLNTKTFTLTGQPLISFLNRAKAIGYRFPLSGPSYAGRYPCASGMIIANPSALQVVTGSGADFTETWNAKLFQRAEPFLNPFWKITSIAVEDLFNPKDPSKVTMGGPLTGRVDDPTRTVGFNRSFSHPKEVRIAGVDHLPLLGSEAGAIICREEGVRSNARSAEDLITSITLVGPDDKTPEDAMFPPPTPGILQKPGITGRPIPPLP